MNTEEGYNRIKELYIELLKLRENDPNEPYLISGGRMYTRQNLIDEIENNTDFGRDQVGLVVSLTIDLMERGRIKQELNQYI